jgi:hypothetical protein
MHAMQTIPKKGDGVEATDQISPSHGDRRDYPDPCFPGRRFPRVFRALNTIAHPSVNAGLMNRWTKTGLDVGQALALNWGMWLLRGKP